MATTFSSKLAGTKLQSVQSRQTSFKVNRNIVASGTKKVNSYDDTWSKEFWGTGLFLEDKESSGSSVWKKIEKKKLLSSVEKSGLLSKAEGAGLTLSKIEKLGLLSTAERLGLLTLAEDALSSDPGSIAALSMPCIVAAILSASLIPHDNSVTTFISYALALVSSGAAGVFFIGGFVISFLQEE